MISGLLASDFALRASVLVSELTFLGVAADSEDGAPTPQTERMFAHKGKHTHILDLVEALPELRCNQLVLMHFSSKHTIEEINRALADALPAQWWARTNVLHHQNRNQRSA